MDTIQNIVHANIYTYTNDQAPYGVQHGFLEYTGRYKANVVAIPDIGLHTEKT